VTAVPFDTLKLARALRDATFSPEQAEGAAHAIAEAVQTEFATKPDLREVEAALSKDIREVEAALSKDIREVEAALSKDIREVETSLRADLRATELRLTGEIASTNVNIASLNTNIASTKAEILKWTFGAIGFQTFIILGATAALIRIIR
jgi:hypothetical protein